jgi:hypothetical protein
MKKAIFNISIAIIIGIVLMAVPISITSAWTYSPQSLQDLRLLTYLNGYSVGLTTDSQFYGSVTLESLSISTLAPVGNFMVFEYRPASLINEKVRIAFMYDAPTLQIDIAYYINSTWNNMQTNLSLTNDIDTASITIYFIEINSDSSLKIVFISNNKIYNIIIPGWTLFVPGTISTISLYSTGTTLLNLDTYYDGSHNNELSVSFIPRITYNQIIDTITDTEIIGYNEGYEVGYEVGYDTGEVVGYNAGTEVTINTTSLFVGVLDTIGTILGVEIFPNIKLGYFVGLPLIISLVLFILKIARGNG